MKCIDDISTERTSYAFVCALKIVGPYLVAPRFSPGDKDLLKLCLTLQIYDFALNLRR